VAAVLSAATRSTDPLYRKGGEELVVLVPDADLAATTSVAARLQEALRSARIPHGGDGIEHVSASFGCAVGAVDPELSPRHVLERAGLCMLRAKNSGRDRIETRPMPVTSA
jgi:diguanylate cyclase